MTTFEKQYVMQGVDLQDQKFPFNPDWNSRFKKYALADTLSDDEQKLLSNAEELLQQSQVIKNSRSTSAGIFRINGAEYFIKRSNVNGFFERLRRIGRVPRALRSWAISRELEKISIRVPAVYAAITTTPFKLPGASYLITESFAHPMTVGGNFAELKKQYAENESALIKAICSIALKIHDHGIEHGDLKMNNFLAIRRSDGSFELGLFDFDGSSSGKTACSDQVRMRELARMASSYFIDCCEKKIDIDYSSNLKLWAQCYAECGGKDYAEEKFYVQRLAKFVIVWSKHKVKQ